MYKLSIQMIIKTAADLADKNGLENLTLASLADKLNVKKPSLYNHINGLPDLKIKLAVFGAQELKLKLLNSAIGMTKEDAIISMAIAYREFAFLRPGLYSSILPSPSIESNEHKEAMQDLADIILKIVEPYNFSDTDKICAIRGFRSILHGFISLEMSGAFHLADIDKEKSFVQVVKTFLNGLMKV